MQIKLIVVDSVQSFIHLFSITFESVSLKMITRRDHLNKTLNKEVFLQKLVPQPICP